MTGTARPAARTSRREVTKMEKPEDVAAMLRLHAAGWGKNLWGQVTPTSP